MKAIIKNNVTGETHTRRSVKAVMQVLKADDYIDFDRQQEFKHKLKALGTYKINCFTVTVVKV